MTQPRRRLVVLKVSPWSERAKWALDHHAIAYETIEHTPFLGERRLRRLVGKGKRRATTPVLITDEETLSESWDIVAYADREGKGTKLILPGREDEVRRWVGVADQAMAAGRVLLMMALVNNPAALDASAPSYAPRWTRPLLRPAMRYAARWFIRKYDLKFEDAPAKVAEVRSTLETLRSALSHGARYLLGSFSYADVAMAVSLQGVLPVADRYLPLESATREAWTRAEIAAAFPDLLAWRDQLYELHRLHLATK